MVSQAATLLLAMVLQIKPVQDISHHRYADFGVSAFCTRHTLIQWARWARPSRSRLANNRPCNRNWTAARCLSVPLLLLLLLLLPMMLMLCARVS